jgi:acetolactate synthase-1/2/3 large subunit
MTTRMTTAEATVDALLAHGIDTLYALPGVHNDHLFDAIARSDGKMRVLHTRHEQTSAYMALGAALVSGKPQAYAAVPGPGILNTTAALLTASGMGAPVIAIAGQIPADAIDAGRGHLHEMRDQIGLLGHLTKHTARIGGAFEAHARVADAVRIATAGRTGPVALECAIDTWGRVGIAAPVALRREANPPIDDDAIEAAARILGAARKPIIVAGGGALGASAELLALAEMLEAPVVTYRRARGVIPTSHRLAASLPVGHRLWKDADAVIGVGTRLHYQQTTWGTDTDLKIVRIDIDPEEIPRFRTPDCAILADAADALRALLAKLPAHNRARARRADVEAAQAWFAGRIAKQEPQLGFLRAIRAALPDDGIVVEDVTQCGFVGRLAFPVDAPRRYISAGYQDNLGWAYGTALGAQSAFPDRAVVAICGDGGFMYQAQELASAMRHSLPVVAIVFDDGAFGNVRRIQKQAYGNRVIASDLHNPDFVRFAESFGVAAWRATDAAGLGTVLKEALEARAPALIHVPVGEMPSPWDMLIHPRVRGFEDAWRVNLP